MWGKLNQMVSGEQQKIDNLESQLQEEQQRNKTINEQFKKVLKEKEKEIHRLKANAGEHDVSRNGAMDDREEMKEEITNLQRKVEEYQMLNTQKDENVKVLMEQLNEAEELKFKVEAQERVNSEKLMFELAGRIDAHEKISNKLEEVKEVLEQRNVAVAELADEVDAKDQMLKAKDDAIKQLRGLAPNPAENALAALEISLSEKEREIQQMRGTITYLENEKNMQMEEVKSEELIELKNSYTSLETEKLQLQRRNMETESANKELVANMKELEGKITSLESILKTLQSEVELKNVHAGAVSNELKSTKEKFIEFSDSKNKELKEIEESYSSLREEHVQLLERNQNVESINKELLTSNRELESKVVDLEDMIKSCQEEIDLHKKQLNASKECSTNNNDELRKLKGACASLKEENSLLLQKKEELESQNGELLTCNKELQDEINHLKDTIENLQSELQLEKGQREQIASELNSYKEQMNDRNIELTELGNSIASLREENGLFLQKISETEAVNKDLVERNRDLESKITHLDTQLGTQQSELEKNKAQAKTLTCELNDAKEKIKSQRDENEKVLCAEIQQLQNDNDRLSKTVGDLEATILQLDGDLHTSKADINQYKLNEDELKQVLRTANEEKEEVRNQIVKIEGVLKQVAEKSDSRKELRKRSAMECDSDDVLPEILLTSENVAKNQKVLHEVLHTLEGERSELEQLIRTAVKEKNEVMEKNKHLESLLVAEKDKFDSVVEKSALLQAELTEQGVEKNALSSKLEEEITSLNSLLKTTEEQCKCLSEKEVQMNGYIDSLTKDLTMKEEEISKLHKHVEKLDRMLKDSTTTTQQDQLKLVSRIDELENINEELQKSNDGKVAECDNLKLALMNEQQIKIDGENMIKTMKSNISNMEKDIEMLKEKNYDHASYSSILERKGEELVETNMAIEDLLKQKKLDYANLINLFKEVEDKEKSLHESFRLKETGLLEMEGDLKVLGDKYFTLHGHYNKLHSELSSNNERFTAVHSNLISKEKSIELLQNQNHCLNEENVVLKKNEEELNAVVTKCNEQIQNISLMLETKEDTIRKLNVEINESKKGHDLLKMELEKKMDKLKNATSLLQQQTFASEQIREELLQTESNYQKEQSMNNENLRSKESTLHVLQEDMEKLQEKYKVLEEICNKLKADISTKDSDIQAINLNLKSKEESTQLLLSQVEAVCKEKESLKKNEESLNVAVTKYTEQIESISLTLKSKEDTVKKLKLEIAKCKKEYGLLKMELKKKVDELKNATSLLQQQTLASEQIKEELLQTESNYQKAHSMNEDLKSKESSLQILQEDLEKLQEKYRTLEEFCNKLKDDISIKEDNIQALTSTLQSKEESIHLLTNQVENLGKENEFLKKNEDLLNAKMLKYIEEIDVVSRSSKLKGDDIMRLEKEIFEYQKERDLLQSNFEKNVNAFDNLKEELSETMAHYQEEQNINKILKSKESTLHMLEEDMKKQQEKYVTLEKFCEKLQTEISIKEEDILAFTSNLNSKEESVQLLLGQVDSLQKEKESLKMNEDSLNVSMKNYVEKIDIVTNSLKSKEEAINALTCEISEIQKEQSLLRSELKKKVDELKNATSLLQQQNLASEQLKEELLQTESNYQNKDCMNEENLRSKESTLHVLQEDMEKLQENYRTLEEFCNKLRNDVSVKEDNIQALASSLKSKEESIQLLVSQIEGLGEEKEILKKEECSLNMAVTKYKEELDIISERMKSKEVESCELNEQTKKIQKEKESLKLDVDKNVDDLMKAKSLIDQLNQVSDKLNEELERSQMNYQSTLSSTEEASNNLEQQLRELQKTEGLQEKKIIEMNAEMNKREEEICLLRDTLSSKEETLYNKMEEIGKDFHSKINEKDLEIEKKSKVIADLEVLCQQSQVESTSTIEEIKEHMLVKEKQLVLMQSEMEKLKAELEYITAEKLTLNVGLIEKECELSNTVTHFDSLVEERDINFKKLKEDLMKKEVLIRNMINQLKSASQQLQNVEDTALVQNAGNTISDENNILKEDFGSMTIPYPDLEREVTESVATIARLQHELKVNVEEKKCIEESLVEKCQMINELEVRLKKSQQDVSVLEASYHKDIEEKENVSAQKIEDLHQNIDGKTKEMDQFKIKAAKKIKEMNKELKNAKNTITELQEKEKAFENEQNELRNAMEMEIATITNSLESEKELNSDLLINLKEMKDKITELESQSNLEEDVKSLKGEIVSLKHLLREKEENISNLSLDLEVITEHHNTLKSLLDGSLASVREDTHFIKEKYSELSEVITEKELNVDDCWKRVETFDVELTQQSTRLNDMLSELTEKEKIISMTESNKLLLDQLSPGEIECPIPAENIDLDSPVTPTTNIEVCPNTKTSSNEEVTDLEKVDVMYKELEGLKEVINIKDKEYSVVNDSLINLKQQYKMLKEKSVQNKKKCLAMKKVIAEKDTEVEALNLAISSTETEKNEEISQLKDVITQLNTSKSFVEQMNGGKDISSDGSSEAIIPITTQELEWDPTDTTKPTNVIQFASIDDMGKPVCDSMDTVYSDVLDCISEVPTLMSQSESTIIIVEKDQHRDETSVQTETNMNDETKRLRVELEQVQQTLNKFKKKNAMLKKAQIELAKEVDLLRAQPNELNNKVNELEESKEEIKREIAALQQSIINVLEEEELKTGELLKPLEYKDQDIQDQLSWLQETYKSLVGNLKQVDTDFQTIFNQKMESDVLFQEMKLENQNLKITNESQIDTFLKGFQQVSDKGVDFNIEEDKSLEQNIQNVINVLKKEKQQFINIIENEKQILQHRCEEEKVEALRELEITMKKQNCQEFELLKNELNDIAEKQCVADKDREYEKSLKNRALEELELLREQLATSIVDLQQSRETSQEAENKLLGEIERELKEVKGRLQSANLMKDEMEAAMKCEELLKQQFMKENEILKSEMNVFKEGQQQQSDSSGDFEEVRKHKDMVIKKLKLKLRKEISDRETFVSEATKMSAIITEKENDVKNLEELVSVKSDENEKLLHESMRQITEKEDLVTALKDELAWLKDSMAPLMTKAENADKLLKDKQDLKYCIETKDNELAHLKEHALLKENELAYLIDQEKNIQEEYASQKEKFRLKDEEKSSTIQSLKGEVQWLQKQVDDLSPKAEQLNQILEEFNSIKENLHCEISNREDLENQLQIMEGKQLESEKINEQWQGHCQMLQVRLDDLMSNKVEVDQLNTSVKEMEELYSSKNEELAQVNDSLSTREVQLEDLRGNLIEKTNAFEELQGMLQNNDVENCQLSFLLDQERIASGEKVSRITELTNELTKEQDRVAMLNQRLEELNEQSKQLNDQEKVTVGEKDSHITELANELTKEQDRVAMLNQRLEELNEQSKQLIDQERVTTGEKDSHITELINELTKEQDRVAMLNQRLEELNEQSKQLIDQERMTTGEKDSRITELTNELTKEQDTVAMLNQSLDELNEQSKQLIDQERVTAGEKDSHITELINELTKEQDGVAMLNKKLEELNEQFQEKSQQYSAEVKKMEDLELLNNELKNIECDYNQQKEEFEKLNQTLIDNGLMLEKHNSDNSRLHTDMKAIVEQFSQEAIEDDNVEDLLETLRKCIEKSIHEVFELKNLCEEKEQETANLINEKTEILNRIDIMQTKYEDSINLLQKRLSEKEASYNNSLAQVKLVKEMLESEAEAETTTIQDDKPDDSGDGWDDKPDDSGDGWDDAFGWESIDNVENEEKPLEEEVYQQAVESSDTTEISILKEQVSQLNVLCEDKDTKLSDYEEKLNKVRSERDILKEKCSSVVDTKYLEEKNTSLESDMEKLSAEKDHKESIIGKLKLKLKQTIKGRDQLKENLQSELDRISQEKDLIFNEFSEKLQQQNIELTDLRNGSQMFSETLKAVGGECSQKKKELEDLQQSLSTKEETIEALNTTSIEMKIKLDELENEKCERDTLMNDNSKIIDELGEENNRKDNEICNLGLELAKIRADVTDFEDVRIILEEAMSVKDNSIEKMTQKMEVLQQEYVKLNSELQSSSNKHKGVLHEQRENISLLNEKVTCYQEEKENMTIKLDGYRAELEAIEILFGLSNENESLIEKVSSWQQQTTNKLKELEHLKTQGNVEEDLLAVLQDIECLCDAPREIETSTSVVKRLKNIQNIIPKLREPIAHQESLLDSMVDEDKIEKTDLKENFEKSDLVEDVTTYQVLEEQIQSFTLLTAELQMKIDELNKGKEEMTIEAVGSENKEDSSSYLKKLIEEISSVKQQVETNISYTKSEWLHIQSENKNLKKQIELLTVQHTEDETSESKQPNSNNTSKLVELKKCFEMLFKQKDECIDSLRKRIDQQNHVIRKHIANIELLKSSSLDKNNQPESGENHLKNETNVCKLEPNDGESVDIENLTKSINSSDRKSTEEVKEYRTDEVDKPTSILDNRPSVEDLENKLQESMLLIEASNESLAKSNDELKLKIDEYNVLTEEKNKIHEELKLKIDECNVLTEEKNKIQETLVITEQRNKCLEENVEELKVNTDTCNDLLTEERNKLCDTLQLLEDKNKSLNEISEELKEKVIECTDLTEESNDLKEEISDLKEEIDCSNDKGAISKLKQQIHTLTDLSEKYEDELKKATESIISLEEAKSSHENQLQEKERIIIDNRDDVTRLHTELEGVNLEVRNALSDLSDAVASKEELLKKNFSTQSELTQLQLENANLKKHISSLSSDDVLNDTDSSLHDVISKKNEAFLELRDSFDDVITQKDSVIDSLRKSINRYREDSQHTSQKVVAEIPGPLSAEKDQKISTLTSDVGELKAVNILLREELDRIKAEKENIDGRFGEISSGLRSDLELALKDKREHGEDIKIYCLKLERNFQMLEEDFSKCKEELKTKETLMKEKNIVISNLQSELENISSKLGYKILQKQLGTANEDISDLREERNSLLQEMGQLNESCMSLQLEVDMVRNEKNQLKLESDSYIEDIFIKNAEDLQNVTNTFEKLLNEKEDKIFELSKLFSDKEEECCEIARTQQTLMESKVKDVEERYRSQMSGLENQLHDMVSEKEIRIEELATQSISPDQFSSLEKDFNSLTKAKDEKINYISQQFNESQQRCNEFEKVIKDKNDSITSMSNDIKSLKNEINILKEANKKLSDTQTNNIKETIMSKGRQLRELRDEFETVFDEKNNIIENIRESLKSSRSEYSIAQQKLRESHENIRTLEKSVMELEAEKLQMESKLSLIAQNKDNLNAVLLKQQEENEESKAYIADILTENTKLKLLCTEKQGMVDDGDADDQSSEEHKLIESSSVEIAAVNESLMIQLKESQQALDDLKKNNVEMEEKIEYLESNSLEMKNELSSNQNILENINSIIENVPDLISYEDDSYNGVLRKIDQVVNKLSNSQTYTNELSKKVHELMEEKPVEDFSSQCDDESKEGLTKSFHDHIDYMQKELLQSVEEKQDMENVIRERYDDILGNLREDLEESQKGYKLLQEENFSLQNQLDVFRNVHIKSNSASSLNSTSSLKEKVADVSMERSLTQEADTTLEGIAAEEEFKSSVQKLKKICRRYKTEKQSLESKLKEEIEEKNKLRLELAEVNEISSAAKVRYDHEIKDLREEVNTLVVEKEGFVNAFKNRNENEIIQMKEMYQISLNKLTHDIQEKDNLIEKYESDIERLTNISDSGSHVVDVPNLPLKDVKKLLLKSCSLSSQETDELEDADLSTPESLLKSLDNMKSIVKSLKHEKKNCLAQIKSQREEITELLKEKEKSEDELRKFNKQDGHSSWEIVNDDISTNPLDISESPIIITEDKLLNEDLKLQITNLQSQNSEKNEMLENFHSVLAELESKLAHEYQVTRSLSENIALLKSKDANLQGNIRVEFKQKFEELIYEKNNIELDLSTTQKILENICSELNAIKSSPENLDLDAVVAKLYQLVKPETSSLNVDDPEQSKLKTVSDENAQLSLEVISLKTLLEQEVSDHEKMKLMKFEEEQNKGLKLRNLKSSASNLHFSLKTMKSEFNNDISVTRGSIENFFRNIPSMVGEEHKKSLEQYKEIEAKLRQKQITVDEMTHHKKVAESRLLDVVAVLQELGEIENVQAKLLEKESRLKNLHQLPHDELKDVDELKRRLLEKDAVISENEERITVLEDKIHIWRGQYLSEDQMKDNESGVSEIIDWPESDQGSMVSDFGSMFSVGSRPSVAPPTPTMDRN